VLEVVTEQKGGDMENLYKICCDEYIKFRLRNKHNEKGNSYTIIYIFYNNYLLCTENFVIT